MFEIGTQVVYGIHGVCIVTGLECKNCGNQQTEYLVLEPIYQPGSRFLLPTHNAAAMSKIQKVLTREELVQMLQSSVVREHHWIAEEGKRKQTYRELISSADREQLMAIVYTLYQHKASQAEAGRKVHLCDENFLRDTEKLLSSEIAFAMNMELTEAKQYLRSCLQK